ncbi:MAG: hypothetical protein ACREIA_21175 [Opitutaceae bacterium]
MLIPGFSISGSGAKRILVRGIGPALDEFSVSDFLLDPTLTVFDQATGSAIAANDDWATGQDVAELMATFTEAGAFPLQPGSKDAAVLLELPAGGYTAQLAGVGGTTGVGLVEVYDVDSASTTSRLVNISGRAQVGIGGGILIPGFVVGGGSASKRFLIRAVGPGLEDFDVTGILADPQLTVFDKAGPIGASDDWEDATNADEIESISATIGAFPLEAGSADAAILIELPGGSYTIHVAGVGGTTGVALVEIYEVD